MMTSFNLPSILAINNTTIRRLLICILSNLPCIPSMNNLIAPRPFMSISHHIPLYDTVVSLFTFFRQGEHLRTPMGEGIIISIRPLQETVVIQLPFGKLYANIRRAVCWGMVPDRYVTVYNTSSYSS